ncbi:amidophosphoribosyltransferase [Halobacillus andaensis]|uniref:Amidophosphoribosyltransferase n=1 Tax=Halobacillus andaensis TaxID=1176239 RepID=A0A917BAJ8_HALAA|nr:ComF family protein [Halobacillus andaensis]MBP2005407.1 competence protein ComFC [Halobacillus andaensis]GGF31224.1 amidophosphoribosyltransferase [Halobacillus andaensis]
MRCVICFESVLPEVNWTNFLLVQKEVKLCTTCFEKFDVITEPGCPLCGRADSSGVCYDCERWEGSSYQGVLTKNVSVFSYNDFARELVARWKYRGDFTLIEAFAEAAQTKYKNYFQMMEADLVAIPLSKERLLERGFNQSDALITLLGVSPHRFLKRRGSEKQSKKGRSERLLGENPFILVKPTERPVVLVDDIYTTGMTVRHLALLLREAGCPEVYSFTLFR